MYNDLHPLILALLVSGGVHAAALQIRPTSEPGPEVLPEAIVRVTPLEDASAFLQPAGNGSSILPSPSTAARPSPPPEKAPPATVPALPKHARRAVTVTPSSPGAAPSTPAASDDLATSPSALSSGSNGSEGSVSGSSDGGAGTLGGTGSWGSDYRQVLLSWLERHKSYPREARLRGLEGRAVLRVRFDNTGKLLSYRLEQPAEHEILNDAALDMIRRSDPLPSPPAAKAPREYEVVVPVRFALAD